MRVRVQVVIEPDDGGPASVHEVAELERGALQRRLDKLAADPGRRGQHDRNRTG
jgi:hypothetical protein